MCSLPAGRTVLTVLSPPVAGSPALDQCIRRYGFGGAGEQERIGRQIIGSTQFLLQEFVILEGKGSGR
jgi:hypothetical protein